MKNIPPPGTTQRARRLRREPTEAEKMMWRLLRQSFPAARFRRQVPIRHFVVDFASHAERLIVEVDGGQHGGPDDEGRTRIIQAEGYRLIRFWNNDVLGNPAGVAEAIAGALLQHHPHPNPPPSRGRA